MKKFSYLPEKAEIIVRKETRRGENLIIENEVMRPGDLPHTKDIIWRSAKGEEVNFNDFLPNEKWRFVKELLEKKEGLRYRHVALKPGGGYVKYGDLNKPGALLSLLHEIGHARIWERTKEKEKSVEKYGQEFARVEREAWAYALRILRQLKNKGLIIEPDLKLEDFKNTIYSRLETYEQCSEKVLKTKGKLFTKGKKFKRVKLT